MNNELLAGLSVLTVINLKHCEDEDIVITHAGPTENNKYLGWIITPEGRPLINTEDIFDTAEDAEAHMHKIVAAARKWDNNKL